MLSRKEYILVVGVLCIIAAGAWVGASHASPTPPYSPWMGCPSAVKLGKVFTCNFQDRLRWSDKPWAFTLRPHQTKSFHFQVKMVKQAPCVAASLYAPREKYSSATKLKCPDTIVEGTA
jgi:hypothetical protein